jgi:hypothetical protein
MTIKSNFPDRLQVRLTSSVELIPASLEPYMPWIEGRMGVPLDQTLTLEVDADPGDAVAEHLLQGLPLTLLSRVRLPSVGKARSRSSRITSAGVLRQFAGRKHRRDIHANHAPWQAPQLEGDGNFLPFQLPDGRGGRLGPALTLEGCSNPWASAAGKCPLFDQTVPGTISSLSSCGQELRQSDWESVRRLVPSASETGSRV